MSHMKTWHKIVAGLFAGFVALAIIGAFLPDEEEEPKDAAPAAEPAEPEPTATPEPEPTATPRPAPTARADEGLPETLSVFVFRSTMDDAGYAYVEELSDDDIIEFAGFACDAARNADSVEQLAMLVTIANEGTGLTNDEAGGAVGAAIGSFCSEQARRLGLGS